MLSVEMNIRVAVVGAGVTGLGSALCLAQQLKDCSITVISSKYFPSPEGITRYEHGVVSD